MADTPRGLISREELAAMSPEERITRRKAQIAASKRKSNAKHYIPHPRTPKSVPPPPPPPIKIPKVDPAAVALEAEQRRAAINSIMAKNRIFGFTKGRHPLYPEFRDANPLQAQLLAAWDNPDFKVFTYTGGNRIGKTTVSQIIIIAVLAGKWPWNDKKIPFPHDLPRKVRLIGHSWEGHIRAVLEPALKFWWPEAYLLKTKRNNQGVQHIWEMYARSHDIGLIGSLEIMSNTQDVSVFEGADYDLVVYDEPPSRNIRVACARGLVDRGGRELFSMTLLSEAWVSREVIKAKLPDGSPDPTVFNINGEIYANVGYGLTQANIDQFAKTLTDDEKQARLLGKPSYMSSLVLPRFDRQTHLKDRFKIPLDALISVSCDFHPSKPWCFVFMATLKNGFKYVCDEIYFRGNAKAAAEELIRVIRQRDYARISKIIIDPLAKSGTPNELDVYSIVAETLAAHNYCLETASKEKENGISILNSLLWTENEMPGLFFFRDCGKTIQEVEDWLYDAETLKPSKVNDDFVECLYRLALLDDQWYPPYENKSSGSCVML